MEVEKIAKVNNGPADSLLGTQKMKEVFLNLFWWCVSRSDWDIKHDFVPKVNNDNSY